MLILLGLLPVLMNIKTFNWSDCTQYGQIRNIQAKSTLFRQGDTGKGFYYLSAGEIKISMLRDDGYEKIIDYCFSGELIGEQGLTKNYYFVTAETTLDSNLYYFSEKNFRYLCTKYPEAAQEFGLSLVNKIRVLANAEAVLNAPADIQLAYYLYSLHKKIGSNAISLDQTSISNYIGKSRVTVWKIFQKWKDENIIEVSEKVIYLHDINKLRQKFDGY